MAEDAEAQRPPQPQGPVYDSLVWETPRKRGSVLDWLRTNPAATPAAARPKKPPINESTSEASIDLGTTTPAAASPSTSRLDRWFPPDRTYIGLQRNNFLFILVPALTIILVILPVGLGVGLSRAAPSPGGLPLPGRGGGPWEGDLTYYDPGLGACGWDSRGSEPVAAVARAVWDAEQVGGNPNTNPLCGRKIRVRRDFAEEGKGEREVEVTVVDRCVGCLPTDLDVSPEVFRRLARVEDGRVLASWSWSE